MSDSANAFWSQDKQMVELEAVSEHELGGAAAVSTVYLTIPQALELSLRLHWVTEMAVGRPVNFGYHWQSQAGNEESDLIR